MDIKDIYKRVRAIDENQSVEECGDMMPLPAIAHAPSQSDSVTMNVSMNGSGPGGIRDLMGILRNIEHGENPANDAGGHDELDALFGEPETHGADELLGASSAMGEEYGNSMQGASGEIKYNASTVTNLGSNDGRAGTKARKVNGGENLMHESLVNRLDELYQEVKSREVDESAKWRDPKHKDKLYTQEPRDPDDYYQSDDDYYNPKPDDYPGAKNLKGGGEYDHNDPLRQGYGRYGVGSLNTHGKRKGMPSRDHIRSLKGSIKDAHGTHPTPKLPK